MKTWYSHDPENGTSWHFSAEEAKAACAKDMAYYKNIAHYCDSAPPDGWHEDIDALQWGHVVPHQRAIRIAQTEPTEDDPDGTEEWELMDAPGMMVWQPREDIEGSS